jgi:hypothetical protein
VHATARRREIGTIPLILDYLLGRHKRRYMKNVSRRSLFGSVMAGACLLSIVAVGAQTRAPSAEEFAKKVAISDMLGIQSSRVGIKPPTGC